MNLHLEERKRTYIINGILEDMYCFTEEVPQTTFLGSTDRKTYTIKTTCQYMGETLYTSTNISPWGKNKDEFVKQIEEDSKRKSAEEFYSKLFISI